MRFETYDDLCTWMGKRGRAGNLSLVRDELDRAVDEEAEVLADVAIGRGDFQRRGKKLMEECRRDAEQHFVEEINEMLANGPPEELNHWVVLTYRRKPKVWAIAKSIYEASR